MKSLRQLCQDTEGSKDPAWLCLDPRMTAAPWSLHLQSTVLLKGELLSRCRDRARVQGDRTRGQLAEK